MRKKSKGGGGSINAGVSGGRRPQRHRTKVQHYTDHLPGTFTKKKKRRRYGNGETDSSGSDSDEDHNHQQQQQQRQENYHFDGFASIDNNNTTTTNNNNKSANKKRKRPQKAAPKHSNTVSSPTNNSSSSNHNNKQKNKHAIPHKLQEMPPPPPPKTVLMPHTASVAPILPLATTCPLARQSLAQQYPVVFGRGLGVPSPPETPEWDPISQYDFYFPEDYKPMAMPNNHEVEDMMAPTKEPVMAPLLQKGPWPVCRVVTSVATHDAFLAVGDSAGFILLYTTGSSMGVLSRLDTTASRREHPRQRQIQAKLEHKCQYKQELLDKRSAFWATEKTPNAIQSITWVGNLIVFLTPSEIEAIQLTNPANSTETQNNNLDACPSQSFGGCQRCHILWTIPVTSLDEPRKSNGNKALLTGGELVGSYVELHRKGNIMLWNTWGVTPASTALTTTKQNRVASNDSNFKSEEKSKDDNEDDDKTSETDENPNGKGEDGRSDAHATDDWPLRLLRDPQKPYNDTPEFINLIPFQRQEEEEKPPPVPIKRSPGRPPKKKPKPKIPVARDELVWNLGTSKCHAAIWDKGHTRKGDRLIVVYSGGNSNSSVSASANPNGDIGAPQPATAKTSAVVAVGNSVELPQVHLALLKLTDDMSEEDAGRVASGTSIATKKQYAKLLKQTAVPISASARNIANFPEVTLNQSTKGTFTFVAGSRGVRMYKTDTMAALRVYGEGVSLHGKAMVWQSCFVLDNRLQQQLYRQQQEQMEPPSPRSIPAKGASSGNQEDDDEDANSGATLLRQNRQGFVWIEQDNTLGSLASMRDQSSLNSNKIITRRRSSMQKIRASSLVDDEEDETEDDESYWMHQAWVVGIPHPFRGPKELKETLYFWQGPEKLPLFTLPLPQQSGGVQSLHPLMTSRNRHRNEGMWLRLMVATVHGECFELSPSLKSDFAGNMYNPGYLVLRDNVEYVEDEDELDKIMVVAPEEDEEEEVDTPVVAAPPIDSEVDGDFADPELAEAIRLSLLESQGKTDSRKDDSDSSDDEEDGSVCVRDDFGDENSGFCIPCEPEPFLRQELLPDFEAEAMMDVDAASGDMSAKDAEFASEVLSILPHAKNAQDRWDQQKAKLNENEQGCLKQPKVVPVQTNGVGDSSSVLPGGRIVRGKRTKPGNLEALLKASIKPELRQFMTVKSRIWGDGSGGRLQGCAWDDTDISANVRAEKPGKPPPPRSEQCNDSLVVAVEPSVPLGNEGDSNEGLRVEQQEMDDARATTQGNPEAKLEPTAELSIPGTETAIENQCFADVPLPIGAIEETFKNGSVNGKETNGMQVAIIELKDYSDAAQQYCFTGTVGIPLALDDCNLRRDNEETRNEPSDGTVSKGQRGLEESKDAPPEKPSFSEARRVDCDKSVPGGSTSEGNANPALATTMVAARSSMRCAACQGRMVRHTCGKRSLPIDFEALDRAEKERKAREEEEKRRLIKEKRRQADAKRREEKKKKKEEEKRKKQEKAEELRRIREAEIAEARANQANIGECLDSGSPRHNEDSFSPTTEPNLAEEKIELPKIAQHDGTAKGVDQVHHAIADAWNEHAEKFAGNAAKAVENHPARDTVDAGSMATKAATSDAFTALATMAQAATTQNQTTGDKLQVPAADATEFNGSVVSTSHSSTPESTPASTAHQRVLHGFFSPSDAYPQHTQPTNIETREAFSVASAAQIERRNQILNSYHGMSGGSASTTGITRVVDLSGNNNPAGRTVDHEPRGHSFRISPMAHFSRPGHGPSGHMQPSLPSRGGTLPSRLADGSRPYFGYTLLSSNNFKARLPLGTYGTSPVITSQTRQTQQPNASAAGTVAGAGLPNDVSGHTAIPRSSDVFHAGSHHPPPQQPPQPPTAQPLAWMHPAQAMRPPPGAWPGQSPPMLGQNRTAVAVVGHLPATGHANIPGTPYHHLHVTATAAPGVVPAGGQPQPVAMSTKVMYNNTTTTTNP